MTSMVLVFGILLFTTCVVTSFVPPEIESACRKEVAFDGDIHTLDFNSPSFPNEAKCFLACVMQKEKIMKQDETIDKAAAKEFFEKVIKEEELKMKIIKAVDECNAEVKANKCETAFEFAKCKKAKIVAH